MQNEFMKIPVLQYLRLTGGFNSKNSKDFGVPYGAIIVPINKLIVKTHFMHKCRAYVYWSL